MLRETKPDGRVADSLLEQSEIRVLLDRIGAVDAESSLGDDETLADHASGEVKEVLGFGLDGVDVGEEKLLELLGSCGVVFRSDIDHGVHRGVVQRDFALERLRERVVD